MKITAAVTHRHGADFEMIDVDLDDPRPNEVLVRIKAVGICHTDLVFRDFDLGIGLPAVFGHEGVGVVEQAGDDIRKVMPGDAVLLSFRSCGECRQCQSRLPSYCASFPALNFTGRRPDGSKSIRRGETAISGNFFGQSSFATHVLAYERNIVKLPADLPIARFAPLACGVQTGAGGVMRSLNCPAGASIVVIGAGTVGLSAIMAAALRQCAVIIAIEPNAGRRDLAIRFGATHVFDPAADDLAAQVRAVLPWGAEYALDTSGHIPAIEAVLGYLAPRGMLGLVGVPADPLAALALPLVPFIGAGFIVKGIIEGDSDLDGFIPELIDLHRQGRFPFDDLIAFYPFDQINQAVKDQHAGLCVKPVLTFE